MVISQKHHQKSGVDNLCITKRKINSKKGSKNSDNFQV